MPNRPRTTREWQLDRDQCDEFIRDLNYQIASAPPHSDTRQLRRTLDEFVKRLREYDYLIAIMTPPIVTLPENMADRVEAAREGKK